MNALVKKTIYQAIDHFSHLIHYLRVPRNEEENQKLIIFVRDLKKIAQRNAKAMELLNLMLANIETYEKKAYPIEAKNPCEVLAFLMEQQDLRQSDLPEIGSQSHVSKILNGERNLTRDQISALSKRFCVSPAVFFDP